MDEKQTILIVEDEEINRRILRRILGADYLVLEAANGEEAWKILLDKKEHIGAVLTDIVMPVMDGYALLEKIRQALMTELPVIVMTGESNIEAEQRALDAGAWDFVSKPYSAKILLSRLRNAIARRQVSVYQKMQKIAAHDPLTGLHNRARMFEKTRRMVDEHPECRFQFCRVDIDHFALYNSAFGEEEGDKLLCYIADIFYEMAQQYDLVTVGRISADIFCACVSYEEETIWINEQIAYVQKKLKEYKKDYLLEVSVGIYVIDEPELSVEEFYLRASMGAQKCKSQYGKHVGYYDDSLGRRVSEDIAISNDMETALVQKQFVVYLQPKVELDCDTCCGAEALVRWEHPVRGLISPGVFIPLFERNGFIAQLDYYVWESTCQFIRGWLDQGVTPMPISVNISRISLYNPELVKILIHLVSKYGFDVSLLQLEITESAYMTSPELMQETIAKLHEAGFTILMDDFGSGYSSLNTLKEIEVDILKIDMKFLPVEKDVEKAEIILASIIRMANWLGMSVVVEGVETRSQRDFLEGAGCNCVQGYYYAKPMPREAFESNYIFREKDIDETEQKKKVMKRSATILVIDDVEIDRVIIEHFLREQYLVHSCTSAEEALVYLKRNNNQVRLILVDNIMPGMSGLDFLTYCKDSPSLRAIPKIMITANDTITDQVQAFQYGAYDYITKPLAQEVILARVGHVMEISRHYRSFENLEYDYRNIAERDKFTGLLNKSAFFEIGERYMENHPDEKTALLVLDFDNFKNVNDSYGHQKGDMVILAASEVLKREFRKLDLIGRFGGDEFMVLMSNIPGKEIARKKASEIIKNVAVNCVRDLQINAGISVGIAFREPMDTIQILFKRADMALYEAKSTGKGKVVLYGEQVPPITDDDKPMVLICGDDPQLYPAIALAYGESAAFANITNLQLLKETLEKYEKRIRAICLDMQKKVVHDSDEFYQYVLNKGGGCTIPILAVCQEGDMEHLRAALELKIQDCITLPPQMDVIQRKLSRAIASGCLQI
ncbi:MAG: EAL domain-containing protein [Hespellia sp.]|nr:EAL domain-containing protein [Hespellia sp.]